MRDKRGACLAPLYYIITYITDGGPLSNTSGINGPPLKYMTSLNGWLERKGAAFFCVPQKGGLFENVDPIFPDPLLVINDCSSTVILMLPAEVKGSGAGCSLSDTAQ